MIEEVKLKDLEPGSIFKYEFETGDFGICKWNLDKDVMLISEKITGYEIRSVKSMEEYISIIAYKDDRILALQDLEDYIKGPLKYYQSTFRIKTKDGAIKWVLLKGKFFKGKADSCKIMSILMFNVSDNKFYEGHDCLTNLPNRDFLYKKLYNFLEGSEAGCRQGALIYLDIDNFKLLNDTYGSSFGDLTLKVFAQDLNDQLDKSCELIRLNGDEFIVLVNRFTYKKEIKAICSKIYDYFNKPLKIMDKEIYIGVSMGVTTFPEDSTHAEELIKFCDFAIYKSKHRGKNTCTFFDKQMSESYYREVLIEGELKKSILNKELYICYQPQINAASNKVIGVEALIRWNSNKFGAVSPAEFIPIAENNGYIVQLGDWVIEEVFSTVSHWSERGYKFNTIAVNVSPVQLKKSDFKDKLLEACTRYNISPGQLEIEITEGTLIEMSKDKIKVLNELMESGINIAIDDFGTGYSSLSYLTKLPISTLKIDKSLIDDIKNYKNRAVIQGIVNISKSLKYKIITEGVETKEQIEALTGLGCNIIQGYYFSRPLPEKQIEDFFRVHN